MDIIEAGFPIASPDDLEAVRQIAKIVGNEPFPDGYVPVICGLSRANKKDIDASWEGVRYVLHFPNPGTCLLPCVTVLVHARQ